MASDSKKNEILIEVEVFEKEKKYFFYNIPPNLNKETFFLCGNPINEEDFTDQDKKENDLGPFEELNDQNCEMYLDNKKIPFTKSYTFDKEGKHIIKYILLKNIKTCKKMFYCCYHISSIDLSNFNSDEVTDMSYMFNHCFNLQKLNIDNLNTKNVINMEKMFRRCFSLKELNVNSFDTSNVTNMNYMFCCLSLNKLDLSKFNTSKVEDMSGFLSYSIELEDIDLSSFDSTELINIENMFKQCFKLNKIIFGKSFTLEKIKKINNVFEESPSIEEIVCKSDLYKKFMENKTYLRIKAKLNSLDEDNSPKNFKSKYDEHELEYLDDFSLCDLCFNTYGATGMYSCKDCNFSICRYCAEKEKKGENMEVKNNLHEHLVKIKEEDFKDVCKSCEENTSIKFHCDTCGLNICQDCAKDEIKKYMKSIRD